MAVKDGATIVASYTYDGLTRRMTKTNGADTRHYYSNKQWRSVEERMNDGSTIDRQFTWGLRDRWDLLRRKRSVTPASLDETLYVLKDHLDPVAIVDETGAVVERYAYDAFGNVRFHAPDYSGRSNSDFDWDFLFHAEFRDSDTNLYNYGYRYYGTSLGRWLRRDPIGEEGGVNLYGFVDNDPCANVDIKGQVVALFQNLCTPLCVRNYNCGFPAAVPVPLILFGFATGLVSPFKYFCTYVCTFIDEIDPRGKCKWVPKRKTYETENTLFRRPPTCPPGPFFLKVTTWAVAQFGGETVEDEEWHETRI